MLPTLSQPWWQLLLREVFFFCIQSVLLNWDDFTKQLTSRRRKKYIWMSNVKLKKSILVRASLSWRQVEPVSSASRLDLSQVSRGLLEFKPRNNDESRSNIAKHLCSIQP